MAKCPPFPVKGVMDSGEKLALVSVAVNLVVTGLKYCLGVFSGSLALIPGYVPVLRPKSHTASPGSI